MNLILNTRTSPFEPLPVTYVWVKLNIYVFFPARLFDCAMKSVFWSGVTLTTSADQVPGHLDVVGVAISPKPGVEEGGGMPGVECLGGVQGLC